MSSLEFHVKIETVDAAGRVDVHFSEETSGVGTLVGGLGIDEVVVLRCPDEGIVNKGRKDDSLEGSDPFLGHVITDGNVTYLHEIPVDEIGKTSLGFTIIIEIVLV